MTKVFGGVCRLTLATGNTTWDMEYTGPGYFKENRATVEVHTEDGVDAVYDRRAVVGRQFLPYVMEEKPNEDD